MANFFISLINYLIAGIGAVLKWVIDLFPDSPFSSPSAAPGSINLGYVTWVLDFPTWILHLAAMLTAIGVYYLIRVLARWVKVARQ